VVTNSQLPVEEGKILSRSIPYELEMLADPHVDTINDEPEPKEYSCQPTRSVGGLSKLRSEAEVGHALG